MNKNGYRHNLICFFCQWDNKDPLPLHTTAQERGSLKGLLPLGTPTSSASLPAFCRQYCWSSAAAWDTLILSTLASSFSCSTSRRMLDTFELEVMLEKIVDKNNSWYEKVPFSLPMQELTALTGSETLEEKSWRRKAGGERLAGFLSKWPQSTSGYRKQGEE